MKPVEDRIRTAMSASGEELWLLVKDPHSEVIASVILNRNLTEEMAIFIAKKKTTTPETLSFLAGDVRFKDSNKLKTAVCRNPKTPHRVTLSLLKFMRVFDLWDIASDRHIIIAVRQKIEYLLSERLPSMPSGVKIALARRPNPDMLLLLMEDGDEKVIGACLDSPALTEGRLCRIINRPATKAAIIRMIAEHKIWSLRYQVRFALIRNFHTPMARVAGFISGMKTADLKDLYADAKMPTSTKPFVFRELLDRGEEAKSRDDEIHMLTGDEDSDLEDIGGIE